MIELLKNWISFFRKSQLTPEKSYSIFKYISSFSPNMSLSMNDIKESSDLSYTEVKAAVRILLEENILNKFLICPICNEDINNEFKEITLDVNACPRCAEDFSFYSLSVFKVSELASNHSLLIKKIEEESYELNAQLLNIVGINQKELYYLITDIEGSELLQVKNSDEYNELLQTLWHKVWPNLLRFSKKVYIPLLAKGDAISILFSDIYDTYMVIKNIPNELINFPNLRLSVFLTKIDYNEKTKQFFTRSIDKKWDLNTIQVTQAFRISSKYKPFQWKTKQDYKIKYLIIDELAKYYNKNFKEFSSNEILFDKIEKDKHPEIEYNFEYIAGLL